MFRWIAILALILLSATGATAADRLALLIGNSRYVAATPLRNPENDIEVVARSLEAVGFTATKVANADRKAILAAIEAFAATVKRADDPVVMVYFAGHGIQRNGRNYLLPVDAELNDADALETTSIDADLLAGRLADTGAELHILVLDACRDDPIEQRNRGATPLQKGLAEPAKTTGQLIAYSTAPGKTASDGDTGTSPYAAALAEAILVPGLDIRQVFDHVREKVMERTRGQQEPWESSAVYRDFHFVPPTTNVEISEVEALLWDKVALLDSAESYQQYINRFPSGRFSVIARQKIENINKDFSFRKQAEVFPIVVSPPGFLDFCSGYPIPDANFSVLEKFEAYDGQLAYISIDLPLRGIQCPNNESSTVVWDVPAKGKSCGEVMPAIESEAMEALKPVLCIDDAPEDSWIPNVPDDLAVSGGLIVESGGAQLLVSAHASEYYRYEADAAEGLEEHAFIHFEGLVRVSFPPREEEAFSVWLQPVDPADLGLTWKYQNTLTALGQEASGAQILDLSSDWEPYLFGDGERQLDSYWSHEGSILAYLTSEGFGQMVFVEPSDAMAAMGVSTGTTFLEASFGGKSAAKGSVYSFAARCAPDFYEASLRFDKDGRRLTGKGKRTRLDRTCHPSGTANAEFTLDYVAKGTDMATVRERFRVDVAPFAARFEQAKADAQSGRSIDDAPITSYWDHNGSTMGLARLDDLRSIVYVKPRRALASAGIEEFTVLFDGKSADGRTYTGEAYSFSSTCGQIAYPVSGTVSADNSTIVLEGKAPKRDGSCTQVGTRTERMLFTFLGTSDSMQGDFEVASDSEGEDGEE